jgi:uncharacterized membrane protein YfcA
MAVGSGVGGGSFFIAFYVLVLGMNAHYAIPLSKATIFGVSIAAFMVNYFRRHPQTNLRPVIDYNLTVMFEPITLVGTLFGVLLNVWLPNLFVLIPLILLLGFTTYKTYLKGKTIHAKEVAAAAKEAKTSEVELLNVSTNSDEAPPSSTADDSSEALIEESSIDTGATLAK